MSEVMKHELKFKFKGERDYIHGTDIYNTLIAMAGSEIPQDVLLTIHGIISSPVCNFIHITNKAALSELADVRAKLQFKNKNQISWIVLTEKAGATDAAERVAYNENEITNKCKIIEQGVVLNAAVPFSFIETIVAMSKYMHQQIFSDIEGKWFFTGIKLDQHQVANLNMQLELKHNMNYRLTKSDIIVEGTRVGELYFSLVKS